MWVTSECINHGVNCIVRTFIVKNADKKNFQNGSENMKKKWKTKKTYQFLTITFVRLAFRHDQPKNTNIKI